MKQFILVSIIICVCTSCSKIIYEQRQDCPCRLKIDFSQCSPNIKELQVWFFNHNNTFLLKDTIKNEELKHIYEIDLKGKRIKYYVWANINEKTNLTELFSLQSSIKKIDGALSDSLLHYSNDIETLGKSEIRDTVKLVRQYANVNIEIKGNFFNREINIETLIESGGYYINATVYNQQNSINAKPIIFSNEYSSFKFKLFRQKNIKSITMRINTKELPNKKHYSQAIPFGEILSKKGYDMQKKELDDINISLDINTNTLNISSGNWVETDFFECEFK